MANALEPIRRLASAYPEAEHTTILGDHEVYRVREKVFAWLGDGEGGGTYLGVKLKDSQEAALLNFPFVSPMPYGMAKWGWVNVNFPKGPIPKDLLRQWIDESYRHTAPKKLLKQLDGDAAAAVPAANVKAKATRPAKKTARAGGAPRAR